MTDREEKMLNQLAGIGIALDVGGYHADAQCVRDALAMLMEQKPVPVESKVSEWLEDRGFGFEGGTTWACKKCKYGIHEPFVWNPYDSGYNYCPNCGAKMEG